MPIGDSGHADQFTGIAVVPSVLGVEIDIKPGSDPNCFNSDGNGVIPVAILGNADLNAGNIDASTVTLEDLTVKAAGKINKLLANIEDVNSDGVFSSGSRTATLTGKLFDGTPIEGTDSICIVP